ncbi:MAG: ribonuclease III [Holosporaceae bacterium]|jgi:ribonuclease III|nr:ribonuclease III [Holosporaceae bacterium]
MPMPSLGDSVAKLQNIIEYVFKDLNIVAVALSHPGLNKSRKNVSKDFERLEFLGDRVLGLSLSCLLYRKFPEDSEGDLAMRISVLAGTDFLIDLAKKTKIVDCFSFPKDFFVSINKNSSSIADMIEAVLGAVFLDSNFEIVMNVVTKLWKDDIDNIVYKKKDSKSLLQELSQAKHCELPTYRLVKVLGQAHDPVFEIEVMACGMFAVGCGNSKRNAEHDAASKLIKKIKEAT